MGLTWVKKRSPLLQTEPTFQHPDRCLNCGHLQNEHALIIGCLVEGGTKYVESSETGEAKHVCSCEQFIPAPAQKEAPATI